MRYKIYIYHIYVIYNTHIIYNLYVSYVYNLSNNIYARQVIYNIHIYHIYKLLISNEYINIYKYIYIQPRINLLQDKVRTKFA